MILQYLDKEGGLVLADVDFPDPLIEATTIASAHPSYIPALRAAFARLRDREDAAARRATAGQAAITYGDYVTLLFRSPLGSLRIWGRISTRDELLAREDEVTMGTLDSAYQRGFRYGWWYSDAEPGGEPGTHHVAGLTKITQAEFEAARARRWRR